MSAKQLDSNAELKLWLDAATDPERGYEANIEALNNIASKYGNGPIADLTPKTQGNAEGPVRISGDADYNSLPRGTEYIGPDGKVRKKR